MKITITKDELRKALPGLSKAGHFAPNGQGFYCGGCPHQAACKTWHIAKTRTTARMAA